MESESVHNPGNTIMRTRFALLMMRAWNSGTEGFDSSVVMAVNGWIDGGMEGPVPWPDSPFFAEWANHKGWSNIGGYVGFRFTVPVPGASPQAQEPGR